MKGLEDLGVHLELEVTPDQVVPVQVVRDYLLVFWVQRHVGLGEELIVKLMGIEDLGESKAGGLTLFIRVLR